MLAELSSNESQLLPKFVSPPPVQTTPSRSSWLKITLKLPTQTRNLKPSRAPCAVHKERDLDSDRIGRRRRIRPSPWRGRKAATHDTSGRARVSVVGSSHTFLGGDDQSTHTGNGTPAEGEVDEEESGEVAAVPVVEVVPKCYRWISTLKAFPDAPPGDKMLLSFFVPTLLLRALHQSALDGDRDVIMVAPEQQQQQSRPRAPVVRDADGCMNTRYRLVRDWERGACGMEHLHLLEERLRAVAV
ncbi:hypothetical protein BC827DRAFT_1157759 [Russula dissimulans]|nr:hypothetical protein BC827DRAFT_1157759 [Russula dissimulans]